MTNFIRLIWSHPSFKIIKGDFIIYYLRDIITFCKFKYKVDCIYIVNYRPLLLVNYTVFRWIEIPSSPAVSWKCEIVLAKIFLAKGFVKILLASCRFWRPCCLTATGKLLICQIRISLENTWNHYFNNCHTIRIYY